MRSMVRLCLAGHCRGRAPKHDSHRRAFTAKLTIPVTQQPQSVHDQHPLHLSTTGSM